MSEAGDDVKHFIRLAASYISRTVPEEQIH